MVGTMRSPTNQAADFQPQRAWRTQRIAPHSSSTVPSVSSVVENCSTSPQSSQRTLNALLQRLIGIDSGFRMRDRFKARPHFEIELEITIPGGMGAGGSIGLKAPPCRLFRADAFQNSPRLQQRVSRSNHVFDLIAPRKRTPVEKDRAERIPRQKISSRLHHELQAEVVLPRGVLNFPRQKYRVAELIFAQHAA